VRVPLTIDQQCELSGLPKPVAEFRFAPPRKWRFDFAWPDRKLSLEIEGGVWTNGRHTRGRGYERDMEKYSTAAVNGWCVLRVTPRMVQSGEALALVEQALRSQAKI